MSVTKTISISEHYHLFEDLIEDDYVYLELEDVSDCTFELWSQPEGNSSRAVVKISREDFEEMIDAYQSENC
jgi:hypothetical protein